MEAIFKIIDNLMYEIFADGNYEVEKNGVFVDFSISCSFITRTELKNIRDCKELTRATRDRVRQVLDEIEDKNKEEEGGEA